MRQIRLFIDGKWREGSNGETLDVINPANEEVIGKLSVATQEDLGDALNAVAKGFLVWKNTPASDRARIIHKTADLMRERIDEMALINTIEQGKPVGQSKFEIMVTANYFDDLADRGVEVNNKEYTPDPIGINRSIQYEPIGPIYASSPWNLPAMMPGRKIATALAAGCSIIVKPAEETPETAAMIAQCCQDAGLPDGVVNLVYGSPQMISDTLIASPIIRKISFTGSTEVGKLLAQMAGTHMKKATLELGGHAPVIICDDVDVEQVVKTTVPARYANSGQSCMAATRFFVQEKIYDQFVELFTREVKNLQTGDGTQENTDMGPLANERRLKVLEALVKDAVSQGSRITTGGNRMSGKGFFFEPTVLVDVPDNANIMTEEPFGPITPIASFQTIDEVIKRANATPYGLASYVFSHNQKLADEISDGLEVGLVGVNSMNVAGPVVPFGGVKDSGIGREGAMDGIMECLVSKTISSPVTS